MNSYKRAACLICATDRKHRAIHTLARRKKALLDVRSQLELRRHFIALRAIRGVLKLRYLLLGSAVGGGVQISRKIEEWKDGMPDFKWLNNVLPSQEKLDGFSKGLVDLKEKASLEGGGLVAAVADRINSSSDAFRTWLEEAREARRREEGLEPDDPLPDENKNAVKLSTVSHLKSPFATSSNEGTESKSTDEKARLQNVQEELMRVQRKYQKEVERLEKDNKILRQQLILANSAKTSSKRKVKKSIIDLYSEVLDELGDYDNAFQTQDHLPRVIVVGDQSAGKTSALEMIAQARIFPRGAGEIMTRAPVKVTLSEGPYHVAQFKDSTRVFDLTKESDLAELRNEIEKRMRLTVRAGRSISSEVISLTVQGPGLQRMVLVDLPGVISTVTSEMSRDTKEAITDLAKTYMSNPNSIILCIQDGSVDAERSIVTDLVSQMDPHGKRTIFVLTKVDIAEKNMANPGRIRKILDGKLFPMKALGYFAVVTGKNSKDNSIEEIKAYEEEFFRKSRLCKDGILSASQCTTGNLSLAVSECFWRMVKASVDEQINSFKQTRFNLETEWKNSFSQFRELTRDELFEKARGEMLDELIKLTNFNPRHWESVLRTKLWQKISLYVFERIYLPAAQSQAFNAQIDINLKAWAEGSLAKKAVEAGDESLKQEFRLLLSKTERGQDMSFEPLKKSVCEEALSKYHWEEKASDILKVIQVHALEDRVIGDQSQWASAVSFLEMSIQEMLTDYQCKLRELIGPGWWERWSCWKWRSSDEAKYDAIKNELAKLLRSNYSFHTPSLSGEEILVVKKNLKTNYNVDVETSAIKKMWFVLFRLSLLSQALDRAHACRSGFHLYNKNSQLDPGSSDVLLFFRIQRMLAATVNALRQQIMSVEIRRLERELKEVLDEFSQDEEKKQQLLTGRRVQLAEELSKVRHILEKLEEFAAALECEK